MELGGAVVVVTGASAGIGRATALAFARRGADVVLAARREALLREVAREVAATGRAALPVACDVSDLNSVRHLQREVEKAFGRCDVLVNNAGVPGGGPFAEISIEEVERIVRTNFMGVLYCTNAFLPMMQAAGRGHVVNVASLAGRFAVPGSSVYSATKHAVVAFSEALYFELSPAGVLVTAVNPGLVATEGFPHRDLIERGRRVMAPEEVARVIVDVVQRDIGPERSIPRWMASMQAVRVLAPPLYRFGLRQAIRRGIQPTRARGAGRSDARRDRPDRLVVEETEASVTLVNEIEKESTTEIRAEEGGTGMDVYVFIEHPPAGFPGNAAGLPKMNWVNPVSNGPYLGFVVFKGVTDIKNEVIDPLTGIGATGLHVANAHGAGPYGIKSIRKPKTRFVRLYCVSGQAAAVRDAACAINTTLIAAEVVDHQPGDPDDYDVLVDVNGDTSTDPDSLVNQVKALPGANRKPAQVSQFPASSN